ncbi:alpha/beta fold hydrolase [Bradyrhizobium sp. USDA 3650]
MLLRSRTVRGIRLSYLERRGGRIGIVLVHGNSSSKEIFARQISALTRTGYGVVIPDLPGHGTSDRSATPRRTYSFPAYAEMLHRLMSDLGYRTYHVVGWSLGGHIGIEMLARYRVVKSLLLTGTPPVVLTPDGIAAGFRWTPSTALAGRRIFSKADATRYVRAMMGARRAASDQVETALRTDGNARYWMVHNGMAGVGVDEVKTLSEDQRPLAIVQGAADPFLRTEYLAALPYKHIWQGRPTLLDAGHAPHWERPTIFNDHLLGFLAYADQHYLGGQNDLGNREFHRHDVACSN